MKNKSLIPLVCFALIGLQAKAAPGPLRVSCEVKDPSYSPTNVYAFNLIAANLIVDEMAQTFRLDANYKSLTHLHRMTSIDGTLEVTKEAIQAGARVVSFNLIKQVIKTTDEQLSDPPSVSEDRTPAVFGRLTLAVRGGRVISSTFTETDDLFLLIQHTQTGEPLTTSCAL